MKAGSTLGVPLNLVKQDDMIVILLQPPRLELRHEAVWLNLGLHAVVMVLIGVHCVG